MDSKLAKVKIFFYLVKIIVMVIILEVFVVYICYYVRNMFVYRCN